MYTKYLFKGRNRRPRGGAVSGAVSGAKSSLLKTQTKLLEEGMALHHATPGEIVDVSPLGEKLPQAINTTLLRSEHLQVFRVVLRKGEEFVDHAVPGEITVQCLEGLIAFDIAGKRVERLAPGHLIYLDGGQPHALKALENSSVLVTVYHPRHPHEPAGNHMARQ